MNDQSILVYNYDSLKYSTVRDYFEEPHRTKAYLAIRELHIESSQRYRPQGGKGKGSRLYANRDLEKVRQLLTDNAESQYGLDLNAHISLAAINDETEWPKPYISILFNLIGLRPSGTYRAPGARRASNLYSRADVSAIVAGIKAIQNKLSK